MIRICCVLLAVLVLVVGVGPVLAGTEDDRKQCKEYGAKFEDSHPACTRLIENKATAAKERSLAYAWRCLQAAGNRALNVTEMLEDAAKALELDPKNAYAHSCRGYVHAQQKELRGIDEFQKALAPGANARHIMEERIFTESIFAAINFALEISPKRADELADGIVKAAPNDDLRWRALMHRAFLHEFNGRYKLAVRDVLEASKLVKKFIDSKRDETYALQTLCLRAWYHFKAGNHASASEDWNRLKKVLKEDNSSVPSAILSISFALYDIGFHRACLYIEPLLALEQQQPTLAIQDS
jgi:tetratricopeptide (TPR) repeat protein